MRAISIHQPWASMIARGEKTIETRRRPTKVRGDLVIVSTVKGKRTTDGLPRGQALAVVRLVDCRPMTPGDEVAAKCEYDPDLWSWILADVRKMKRIFIRGRQGFYWIANSRIKLEESVTPANPPQADAPPGT